MIDNWEDVRIAHEGDDVAFGTVKSWIAYVSPKPLYFTSYPCAPVIKRLDGICFNWWCERRSAHQRSDQRIPDAFVQHPYACMGSCPPPIFRHTQIRCALSRLDKRGLR